MSFELPSEPPTEPPPHAPIPGQESLWDEAPTEPPRRHGHLRRNIAVVAIAVLALGALGGGAAAAKHQHDEKVRKERIAARIAAEKKAAEAYLVGLRPLAVRVFDAVQPIQDVYDGGFKKPGYPEARDDVLQHGGAVRELKAVKVAFAKLKTPATYKSQATDLGEALDDLITSVTALERSSHQKPNAHGFITSFGPNFQNLLSTEIYWSSTVSTLKGTTTWPVPNENRVEARGRKAPTLGGFIASSDFACAKSWAALKYEDFKRPDRVVRTTYPKISREFRALVTRLKAAPYPSTQRPLRHRLEVGWSSTLDAANAMDAMTAAYKRQQLGALERAYDRLRTALDGLNDLALAYKTVGVSACHEFLVIDDDEKGRSSASA
jgi:hypothetical protein